MSDRNRTSRHTAEDLRRELDKRERTIKRLLTERTEEKAELEDLRLRVSDPQWNGVEVTLSKSDELLVNAGTSIVEKDRRIAELQRSNQAVLAENRELREKLKGMTEKCEGMEEYAVELEKLLAAEREHCSTVDRAGLIGIDDMTSDEFNALREFSTYAIECNDQELAVLMKGVRRRATKLLGEGVREHGRMDLLNDKRNLLRDVKDELEDACTYLDMEEHREELRSAMVARQGAKK